MAPTFGTGDSDPTLTSTCGSWTDATTGVRTIRFYTNRNISVETEFEKERRLETDQKKRNRLSLEKNKASQIMFNERTPNIRQVNKVNSNRAMHYVGRKF